MTFCVRKGLSETTDQIIDEAEHTSTNNMFKFFVFLLQQSERKCLVGEQCYQMWLALLTVHIGSCFHYITISMHSFYISI